jgi:predicted small secreted protein
LELDQERRPATCWVDQRISNRNLTTNMITFIKRFVLLLFATTFLAMVGVGCNTAHGFGKDVQNAGEGIQNSTK